MKARGMKARWILALTLLPLSALARTPIPFQAPYQDGAALVLWDEDYTDSALREIISQTKAAGAAQVSIPIFGCQSGIESSDVGSCEVNSREFRLRLAGLAKEQGLGFSFIPIIATPDWQWRGFFEPEDVEAWFASYTRWIVALARQARELGATEFVAGTEFTQLYEHEARWREVLRAVRAEFPGPVILTVNWGDLNHDFWEETDAIGVSAYYPLSESADPSQEELTEAWQAQRTEFLEISKRYKRPIHITEVGYASAGNAARAPWAVEPESGKNPELQRRCYEAFARTWSQDKSLVRASFWAVGDPHATSFDLGFDFFGKPAEAVISRFFRERRLLSR